MSDKKHRPISEIHQEFVNLASRAGQLQYQIEVSKQDLAQINVSLRDLNLEAAASKAAEPAPEAPKLAAVPSQPEPASGAV